MDNELFELCKDVYERTGWEHEGKYRYYHNDLIDIVEKKPGGDYWENNWWHPLYISDYLLEKLPSRIERDTVHYALMGYPNGINPWFAYENGSQRLDISNSGLEYYKRVFDADTPLKALLKLVIALDDAKELK